MIDVQNIYSRIKLREKILQNLYELWFSTGPEALSGSKTELYPDSEHHKAFHYLLGKELIVISSSGERATERLSIYISAKGIEYVENLLLQKHQAEQ